jgi:excisionase family DNA binding protein
MSKMLTAAQVAEHLCCSISTVRHLTSAKAIPFYKFGSARGSKVLYESDEIQAWIHGHRIAPIVSIAERANKGGRDGQR